MGAEVCVCFGPETSPWYLSVNTYENAPLPPPTSSIFLTPSRGMRLTRLLAVATDPLCCAQEKHTVRCGKKWGATYGRNGVWVGETKNNSWEKWGVRGRKIKRLVGEMGCGWAGEITRQTKKDLRARVRGRHRGVREPRGVRRRLAGGHHLEIWGEREL